jgi:hypothetical protein
MNLCCFSVLSAARYGSCHHGVMFARIILPHAIDWQAFLCKNHRKISKLPLLDLNLVQMIVLIYDGTTVVFWSYTNVSFRSFISNTGDMSFCTFRDSFLDFV